MLLADADVPRINSLRPPANETPTFGRGEEAPIFDGAPGTQASPAQNAADQQSVADKFAALKLTGTLQETSKLLLIRYVSGEFAKAVKALPAGKEGLLVNVGSTPCNSIARWPRMVRPYMPATTCRSATWSSATIKLSWI